MFTSRPDASCKALIMNALLPSTRAANFMQPSLFSVPMRDLLIFLYHAINARARLRKLSADFIRCFVVGGKRVSIDIASEDWKLPARHKHNNEWIKKGIRSTSLFNNRISTPSAHSILWFLCEFIQFFFSSAKPHKRGLNLVKNDFLSECSHRAERMFICKTPALYANFARALLFWWDGRIRIHVTCFRTGIWPLYCQCCLMAYLLFCALEKRRAKERGKCEKDWTWFFFYSRHDRGMWLSVSDRKLLSGPGSSGRGWNWLSEFASRHREESFQFWNSHQPNEWSRIVSTHWFDPEEWKREELLSPLCSHCLREKTDPIYCTKFSFQQQHRKNNIKQACEHVHKQRRSSSYKLN